MLDFCLLANSFEKIEFKQRMGPFRPVSTNAEVEISFFEFTNFILIGIIIPLYLS